MSSRDYENYLSLFALLESFVIAPDLLIYLRSTVPNLVNQIQNRGRNYEESIRIDYLNYLIDQNIPEKTFNEDILAVGGSGLYIKAIIDR